MGNNLPKECLSLSLPTSRLITQIARFKLAFSAVYESGTLTKFLGGDARIPAPELPWHWCIFACEALRVLVLAKSQRAMCKLLRNNSHFLWFFLEKTTGTEVCKGL
jgi:hypothetical protein